MALPPIHKGMVRAKQEVKAQSPQRQVGKVAEARPGIDIAGPVAAVKQAEQEREEDVDGEERAVAEEDRGREEPRGGVLRCRRGRDELEARHGWRRGGEERERRRYLLAFWPRLSARLCGREDPPANKLETTFFCLLLQGNC